MRITITLLLSLLPLAIAVPQLSFDRNTDQEFLSGSASQAHPVHPSIHKALEEYPSDPVLALLSIRPELAEHLAEPRLLQVFGEAPVWGSEGDKLRLRRQGKGFIDLTENQDLYAQLAENGLVAEQAHLPNLTHQRWVRPCFEDISTDKMRTVLEHMTGYYNRYYFSTNGEKSARWLHDHIAEIIAASPFQTYISLSYHTHTFPQPSIIARFEPRHKNASLPTTIIGAHQDSANYLFPLLPAPGADDDMSGSTSILEAFRVLAMRGYIPERGPVEFHWYAAEEAGLYGSQDVARFAKDSKVKVGAMLEMDMTAFIARNQTEAIAFVIDEADADLTKWCVGLAKEYSTLEVVSRELKGYVKWMSEIGVALIDLDPLIADSLGRLSPAGSDYMSWTRLGYPSAFATEGDPSRGGFPGDFDPYVHSTKDRMDVDDESGVFSIDHMARFSEIAIAFVVEQAGWSFKHSRTDDRTGELIDYSNYKTAYASGMKEELHFSGNQLNFLDTVYRVGYALFLIPSQLILTRIRPSLWLPMLEILWGLMTAATNAEGTKRFGISQLNAIPIGGYALQLIAMLIFGWLSSRTGWRATWIIIQQVILLFGAIILSVWPPSFGFKMFGYFLLWLSNATGPILIAWMAEQCPSPEERAILLGISITIVFSMDAWDNILIYPASQAPHYRVGYKAASAFAAGSIIFTLIFKWFSVKYPPVQADFDTMDCHVVGLSRSEEEEANKEDLSDPCVAKLA
ncbi:bacterial leucyl aminopeptidase, partial [Tremellales sp. Uapishka_1]